MVDDFRAQAFFISFVSIVVLCVLCGLLGLQRTRRNHDEHKGFYYRTICFSKTASSLPRTMNGLRRNRRCHEMQQPVP